MPGRSGECWNAEIEAMAPDALAAIERGRLDRQLRYVWGASTFYRRKWQQGGIGSGRPPAAGDLSRLPFTEKRELQEAQNDPPPFGSNQCVPVEGLARMQATGGTSGQPLRMALTRHDIDVYNEIGARAAWAAGLRPGDILLECMNYSLYAGGVNDHMPRPAHSGGPGVHAGDRARPARDAAGHRAQSEAARARLLGGAAMTVRILDYSARDGIATIRLNRPEVLNALDPALVAALIEAMERVRRDEAVRCALITGAGRAFSAGGDLKAMLAMAREEFREYILLPQRLAAEMRRAATPIVAAVHGYVLAGGLELAVNCDIRIAAEGTRFGLPDTPVGMSPTSGMTLALPRIVGMGWAKYLALTGEMIDAAQAQRIGLVTHVVPAGEVEAAALAVARRIAAHPAVAVRHVKRGMDLAADVGLETALSYETDAEVACFDTEAVGVNLRAFVNRKRGG